MKRKRFDDKGVAGFFEDLPSFMIIVIALGVLISSIFYSSLHYIEAWEENDKYEACMELLEGLENYDKLLVVGGHTAQPISGFFSLEKLENMNTTVLKKALRSEYEYTVIIKDLENSSQSWSFGDEPSPNEKLEKVSMFTTIVLKIEGDEPHLARLKVTLW